ncbi:phage tail tape measure protein [Paraburkholderia sp. CNPSo 3157]|uniref:Phage tail tape measure protein n=1 Tax=Paraburkholderia franconis TaxID=2654983 RepID=A0A7X1N9H5_9BURK|nr:phage tail length tape measure family protein [Paraburkholderia franconis]MPW17872.1 phage tail tape measure protein [Paraburkholderia franconis]
MATDERKVQLGVSVDATEARKGFGDVKDAARDMAQSVTTQGAAAGKAIDSVGSGGAASAQKVDAATRSMIQSIQRTTAAMEAGSKSSSAYFQALASQRGISTDALAPYLAQLDAVKAKQESAAQSTSTVDRAAQKFMQTLQSEAQALKEEAATFGMSRTELLAYQAAKLGIGDSAAAMIEQIGRESAALKALRESTLSAAAAVNAFGETEAQAATRISEMVARSRDYQAAMAATSSAAASGASGMSSFAASLDQVRASIAAQTGAMSATTRELASVNEQMDAFRATAARGSDSFHTLYEQFDRLDLLMAKGKVSIAQYDSALSALWKDEARLQQQVSALTARYDPLDAATKKLAADQALLDDAYMNGQVSAEQYGKTLAGIQVDKAAVQLKELAQQEAQLERSLKSGQVSWSEYKKSIADISASKSGLSEIVTSANAGANAMDRFGGHTKAARTEVLRLLNDAANGNFGRFEQSAVVLAEQMDLLSAAASPAGVAILGLAASAVGFVAATVHVQSQLDGMNQALVLTGDYAGTTVSGLQDMSRQATAGGASIDTATEAITKLAATGRLTASEISSIGQATADAATYTSISVDKMVEMFTQLAEDPVKASVKLNDTYHYLTESTYDQITALEKQGDATGAAQLAVETFSKAMEDRTQDIAKNEGIILQGWRDIKNMINGALEAIGSFGATATPGDVVARLQANKAARLPIGQWDAQDEDELKKAVADYQSAVKQAEDKARADREKQQRIDAKRAYDTWNQQFATPAEKRAKEVQTYLDTIATPLGLSLEQQLADEQKINDKDKDRKSPKSARSTAESTSNRDIAALKAEIQARQQQLDLLDQYGLKQDKISDGDKKVMQIEQQLGLAQKDRIGKVTDAQLKEQLGYAQQLAALEKQIDATTRAKQAQKDYSEQVSKWAQSEQSAKDALAQDVALYGTEGEARKLMTTQLQYEAQARETIAKAQRDGHPLSEQQQKDLLAEADARAKVVGGIEAQRDALAGAKQLEQENQKLAAESILDEKDRAAAILAIDAKKWQDLIANAGDGTEAQKKLIEQYNQWFADQTNKPVIDQWKNTVSQIDRDFHDGFLQMLTDGRAGWDSFTKALTNTFKVTVVDAVYRAFVKPLVVNVVANLAGLTGNAGVANALLGQSGGSGAGALGSINNLSTAYSALTKGYGYASSLFGAGYGSAGSAIGGAAGAFGASSAGAFGALSTTGGAAAAAAGDAALSGSAALGGLYGSTTAGVGAAAAASGGSAAASGAGAAGLTGAASSFGWVPVVGWILAGMALDSKLMGQGWNPDNGSISGVGKVLGSGTLASYDVAKAIGIPSGVANILTGASTISRLFGRKNPTVDSAGVEGVITVANGFQGQDFADWTAKGGVFRSDAHGTAHSPATQQQIDTINGTVQSTVGVIDQLTTAIGGNDGLQAKLSQFQYSIRNDWRNQDNITKSLTDLSNSLVDAVYPLDQYRQSGETLVQTATRLTTVFNATNNLADMLGKTMTQAFGDVGLASANVRLNLVAAAGGIDNFNSEVAAYYQAYYSSGEQLDEAQRQMQQSFESLGLAMPKSKDAFRALVSSLDLTTASGQSTFAALIALAPAFDQLTQSAKQAADNQQALWNQYFSSIDTSDQQLAMNTRQLQDQFNALGVAMPKTNAEFQALVENMDTSNPSVKALQNALLALAPAFAQVTSATDQAAQAAAQAAQQQQQAAQDAMQTALGKVQTAYDNQVQAIQSNIDSINQFIDSLTSLKQSLALGDLSTLSPQDKYNAEKQLFEQTSAKAMAGDATAQGQLPQVAQDFLNASKAFNASSQAYVDDYNQVQSALDQNIATAHQQLSAAQLQLDATKQEVQGILNLNQTVQSLADALKEYFAAQVAAGQTPSGSSGSLGNGLDYTQSNGVVDFGSAGGHTISSGGGITFTGISDSQLSDIGQHVSAINQGNLAVQQALQASGATFTNAGEWSQALFDAEAAYWNGSSLDDAIKSALGMNGSHAGGADYIPFDGYRAELHKGEAVITSANNQKLSQMLNIDWSKYGRGDNAALIAEIQALRGEVAQLKGTVATVGAAQLQQSEQQHAENRDDMSRQTRHMQTTADASQQTAGHTGKIAQKR